MNTSKDTLMDLHATVVCISMLVVFIVVFILVMKGAAECKCAKKSNEGFDEHALFGPNAFDVYLINMTRNADRLNAFMDQYKASDMAFQNFYRYEAVDGRAINIQDYVSPRAYAEIQEAEETGYRLKHYQLTPGGVGCYLSHYNLLRIIHENKKPYGIVFEDDAIIHPKIYSKLQESLAGIPDDWDIVLLGCHCVKCANHGVYSEMTRFWQMHGYIVRRESAARICKYLDKILIEQQIDTVLSEMSEKGVLKIYCLNDVLSRQNNSFKTTIQLPIEYKAGVDPFDTINA